MPTPEQAASHYALLQQLGRTGSQDPLSADAPTATINNPRWFTRAGESLRPTPARDRLHKQVITEVLGAGKAAAPGEAPIAILLAGPPGAGKSTSLNDVFTRGDTNLTGGLERDAFTVIDADSVKSRLIVQARADGSLDAEIKPTQVKALEAQGETFSDLDLASLVHEESSLIARSTCEQAVSQRKNVVLDQVCSSPTKTTALVNHLHAAGYTVNVVEIHATRDFSIESTFGRYVHTATHGGQARRIPTEVISSVFNPDATSRPRQAIETLLTHSPCPVSEYRRYDATQIAQPPTLVQTGSRTPHGHMARQPVEAPHQDKAPHRLTKAQVLAGHDERARQIIEDSRRSTPQTRRDLTRKNDGTMRP